MIKSGYIAAVAVAAVWMPVAVNVQAQDGQPAPESSSVMLFQPVAEPAHFSVPDAPISRTIGLDEVEVLTPPQHTRYQPEGSNADLMDEGKSFDIACNIDGQGYMRNCQAAQNGLRDQTFVDIALENVGQTRVGPLADDGQPTEGRILVVTCQFRRTEDVPHTASLASLTPAE